MCSWLRLQEPSKNPCKLPRVLLALTVVPWSQWLSPYFLVTYSQTAHVSRLKGQGDVRLRKALESCYVDVRPIGCETVSFLAIAKVFWILITVWSISETLVDLWLASPIEVAYPDRHGRVSHCIDSQHLGYITLSPSSKTLQSIEKPREADMGGHSASNFVFWPSVTDKQATAQDWQSVFDPVIFSKEEVPRSNTAKP